MNVFHKTFVEICFLLYEWIHVYNIFDFCLLACDPKIFTLWSFFWRNSADFSSTADPEWIQFSDAFSRSGTLPEHLSSPSCACVPQSPPVVLSRSEGPFCGPSWCRLRADGSSLCTPSLLARETVPRRFRSCLPRVWRRDSYHFCSSTNYFCPWPTSVCLAWFSWSVFTASWSYFYNILR